MTLSSGARLGAYEILAKLGEGGMGEVYRARDTRLKRDVAIKVLPDAFARDPDRLTRFEREAELLATLNHPNIASVYGFEEAASGSGIVLELVEGPTLSDRIAQGPVPVAEALSIARQMTDALDAAHQKGIVHRDLKPANIKFTAGGQVKVLDFGLAKAMESATAVIAGASISPTMVSPATQAGIILGTAAYMSPEQARGKAVDQRADIWAFGCVLFEMLTGRSPFGSAETVSDSIAAILTREPDWNALPADTPASVRRLLRRCTHKDVDRRIHHIGDARLELDDAAGESVQDSSHATGRAYWRTALPWAVGAIGVAVAAVTVLWPRADRSTSAAPVTRLELTLPPNLELYTSARTIALSPDGSRLAFIGVLNGSRQIYLRRLDHFEATTLRGSDAVSTLFFSPDGTSIGFVTSSGLLKTISLTDGVVLTVSDRVSFLGGGAWGADGSLIVQRGSTLWRVPRTGGEPKQLMALDAAHRDTRHAWPIVLPDGKTMLFAAASNDGWRIDSLDLDMGERRTIIERGTLPLYVNVGQLAYFRDGQMFTVPFDAAALKVTGPAAPLIEDVPTLTSEIPLLDVSLSGAMMYSATTAFSTLVWVSRGGEEQVLNGERRSYANPRMSPDGQRFIVQAGELWVEDLARATFSRLTTGTILGNGFPIWLPDGRVMYRGQTGLRVQGTSGPGGDAQVLPGTTDLDYPGVIAPDGDTLVFLRSTQDSSFNILTLSLRNPAKTSTVLQTPSYEGGVRLSPDGRWMSYVSNETGRNEIYLRPFPGPGERQQVSTDGGTQAIWNPNGREIFYRVDDKMMVVQVTTSPTLKMSSPELLFEARYAYGAGITIPNFDVSRDGQRFVMVKPESGAGRLNVVLNWFADRATVTGKN
ncbi:MAG TPA: protein kinase [Vicinamibacterales bacterium]|nr:protein kinase [Vicinamibacterales bacterium]